MKTDQKQEILTRLGIEKFNDMQEAAYETICREKDVLLLAPTGSGKTLAFLLPILQNLRADKQTIQCLILTPSRELALQTEQVWRSMGTGFKVNSFYGGHDMETELNSLSAPPAVLIGTPGRISDHIHRKTFDADAITMLVLDEFDKSLALGFEEEMSFITSKLTRLKKRILVSATNAKVLPEFTGITAPSIVDFLHTEDVEAIVYKKVTSPEKDKIDTLFRLLCYIGAEPAIIFCNHREAAERTQQLLHERDIDTAFFHGGLEQVEREQALARFRNGSVHYMVATDLAARGLDITGIKHIIHYHLPSTLPEFLHRNGRTARMGNTGTAYMLLHTAETIPHYTDIVPEELPLEGSYRLPPAAQWTTVYISGGKKDKINKTDIAGFFMKTGKLAKEELGLIEVKDHLSYAAVKKGRVKELLQLIKDAKMKGNKYKIAVAK